MRTKKILVFLLITVLAIGLSACGMANDERPLTRSYGDNDNILGFDMDRNRNIGPDNNGTVRNYGTYNRYGGYNPNAYGYDGYNGYRTNRFNDVNGYDNRYRTNQFRTNANRDADRMAEAADRVKGVDGATVVIAGGNAYVALDIKDKVNSAQANRVEREVYRQLTKTANRYNVYITSDDDMFGRLRDVGDGIRNGTPVNDYRNDLRDFDTRFRTYRR